MEVQAGGKGGGGGWMRGGVWEQRMGARAEVACVIDVQSWLR